MLLAQPQAIWDSTYGGPSNEQSMNAIIDVDGNYVFVGWTTSSGGDIADYNGGSYDAWVTRVNRNNGAIIWQNTLGGDGFDQGLDIISLQDGNLLMLGRVSGSAGGDIHNYHGSDDIWLVKLDLSTGDTIWTNCYGGSGGEFSANFIQHTDGSIYVTGYTATNNGTGDVPIFKGGFRDAWVIKVSEADGLLDWAVALGGTSTGGIAGSGNDNGYDILELADGNVIMVGHTTTNNNNDVSGFHYDGGMFARADVWAVKLDHNNGAILDEKCFGGDLNEQAPLGTVVNDSVLVVTCTSPSINGDAYSNNGGDDFFAFALNTNTWDTLWARCYGGSISDKPSNILYVEKDTSVLLIGGTYSSDGYVHNSNGWADVWVVKINPLTGDTIWTNAYGGYSLDQPLTTPIRYYANKTCQEDIAIMSFSRSDSASGSKSEDNPPGLGTTNMAGWLIKIDLEGNLLWDKTIASNGPSGEQPRGVLPEANGDYLAWFAYSSNDSGAYKTAPQIGGNDYWIVKLSFDHIQSQLDIQDNGPVCDSNLTFIVLDQDSSSEPISRYYWNFDDIINNTDSGVSVDHLFSDTGAYQIRLIKEKDCALDTVFKSINISPLLSVNIPNDTIYCQPQSLEIQTFLDEAQHLWSTGDSSSSITITAAGTYWVNIFIDSSCQTTDSFNVIELIQASQKILGDTTIYIGDTLEYELSTFEVFDPFWNSSEVSINCDSCHNISICPILDHSVLILNWMDSNSCEYYDTATINVLLREPFLPNVVGVSSSINNSFGLNLVKGISNYEMEIFDRRGELVFESTNPSERWRGFKYNNLEIATNVYTYAISFETSDGKVQQLKGNVTVLD